MNCYDRNCGGRAEYLQATKSLNKYKECTIKGIYGHNYHKYDYYYENMGNVDIKEFINNIPN